MRPNHYRHRCEGFTLLEVLVAFSILSVSLALIYQLLAQGIRSNEYDMKYTQAIVVAEGLLAEAGITSELAVGTRSGITDAGYQWRLTVKPYLDVPQAPDTPDSFLVLAEVGWGGEYDQVSLTTIRLRYKRQT